MTVTVYRSGDAGAPAMSTAIGGLIPVLDAVLVNGYGSKAALGWIKEYTGTNKAVYKSNYGTQKRLYVNDSLGNSAILVGAWDAVAAVDYTSLRDPFTPNNIYCNKGDSNWTIVANSKFFYLFTRTAAMGKHSSGICFGDIESFDNVNDLGRTYLCGTNGSGLGYGEMLFAISGQHFNISGSTYTAYQSMAGIRDCFGGLNTSCFGKFSGFPGFQSTPAASQSTAMPTKIAKKVYFTPVYLTAVPGVFHAGYEWRGKVPGMYCCLNYPNHFKAGDTISFTSGSLTGKTLECFTTYETNGSYGTSVGEQKIFLDVTGDWGN